MQPWNQLIRKNLQCRTSGVCDAVSWWKWKHLGKEWELEANLVLELPLSLVNLKSAWNYPYGKRKKHTRQVMDLKFPSSLFTWNDWLAPYTILTWKQSCKRVLSEPPHEVTKAALSCNTERAAAIATIIQNRDRLELATPFGLTLPLHLQYRIVRIS